MIHSSYHISFIKRAIGVLLINIMAFGCVSAQETQTKPNLLFIMTDQQHYFTMNAYGNKKIQTPALDGLSSKAFVFQKAYVTQPVCAPSRASIMTGLFPHSHGTVDNNHPLPTTVLTLPELMEDSSYSTAYIGKWHLGDEIFQQRGFDKWISMEDGYFDEYAEGRDRNERSDYHHWLMAKGYKPDKKGHRFSRKFAASLPIEHCKPAFLAEQSINHLETLGNQPFIMYVSFLEPHKPYTGPFNSLYDPDEIPLPANFNDLLSDDNAPKYYRNKAEKDVKAYATEQDVKELLARYWGLVTQVDRSVGAILDRLEALGLDENTIVVYTSDHGSMMGSHRLISKDVMYEESVRVPWLLKAPQISKTQRNINERVSHIDLVPTLLDLLNQAVPKSLQGESLVPFLNDKKTYKKDVFIEWPGIRTIISDGWKMALIKNDKSLLFNLNTDSLETNNLFYRKEYKDKIKDLSSKIKEWQAKNNDAFPLEY